MLKFYYTGHYIWRYLNSKIKFKKGELQTSNQVWAVVGRRVFAAGVVSFLWVGFLTRRQRRRVLTHLYSHTKWALTGTSYCCPHSPSPNSGSQNCISFSFPNRFLIQSSNVLIKTVSEEKCISFTTWSHELLHYKLQNTLILKVFSNLNDCVTPWNTFKIKLWSILKQNPVSIILQNVLEEMPEQSLFSAQITRSPFNYPKFQLLYTPTSLSSS